MAFADRKGAEMMGDDTSARSWFEDFLVLLTDADSDVPVYQQAKTEYAKLASN